MLGTSLVVLGDVVGVGVAGIGEGKEVACNFSVGVGGDRDYVSPTQHRGVVPTQKRVDRGGSPFVRVVGEGMLSGVGPAQLPFEQWLGCHSMRHRRGAVPRRRCHR